MNTTFHNTQPYTEFQPDCLDNLRKQYEDYSTDSMLSCNNESYC